MSRTMTAKREMMRTIPITTVGRTTSDRELRPPPTDVWSTVITLTSEPPAAAASAWSGLQSVKVAEDLCRALSRAAMAA